MTSSYNRSPIYDYSELNEVQKAWIADIYFDNEEDANEMGYVILDSNKTEPLPLSMFMRCDGNNFTHGIYSTSAFDGYFVTLNRSNDECVIAHKYF